MYNIRVEGSIQVRTNKVNLTIFNRKTSRTTEEGCHVFTQLILYVLPVENLDKCLPCRTRFNIIIYDSFSLSLSLENLLTFEYVLKELNSVITTRDTFETWLLDCQFLTFKIFIYMIAVNY